MSHFNETIEKINDMIDKLSHLTTDNAINQTSTMAEDFAALSKAMNALAALPVPSDQASKDQMISALARIETMDNLLRHTKEKTRAEIMSVLKRLEANKSYQKQK